MIPETRQFTVVGLGEILWDFLPTGKQLGGAPANFAYHAQALGARGIVVSCIGQDDLGKEILQKLHEVNLDTTHMAVDMQHATGTVSVELDPEGKPEYIIHEDVAWDFIPYDSSLDVLAERTDAVCYGSLCQRSSVSRTTVQTFIEAMKPNCLRICDINLRQTYYNRDIVHDMLYRSSVLKLNDEELPIVAQLLGIDGGNEQILLKLQQRYDLKLIVLTMGAEGSTLFTMRGASSYKITESISVADTVGTGDAFTAVVCMGLLQNWELDKINKTANQLAAFVCTQKGAMPPVSSRLVEDLYR